MNLCRYQAPGFVEAVFLGFLRHRGCDSGGGGDLTPMWCEVYWVLFLGIYLILHYFPGLILFPKPDFNLDRGSVPQALVESGFIPPIHPLKRRDLHLDNVIPPASMDQLVLVGAVHVFSQSIVIGIANRSSGRLNPEFSELLVVDNADVLLGFNRWLQHCCFELIVVVH